MTHTSAHTAPTNAASRRTRILTLLSLAVGAGLAWGGYEYLLTRNEESTDNAYVQGHVVQVTPAIGGTVSAVLAEETEFVKAGQTLVQIDPADAQLALDRALAALGQTARQVRTLYANDTALAAQVAVRESDIRRARTELERARDDLQRRRALAESGAVSGEEVQHSQSQLDAARTALSAAEAGASATRAQLASNQAQTEGTTLTTHPAVHAAATQVREAYLNLLRTRITAPVDGHIAKRTVQPGQRISAGAPLLALVALEQVWVEANFKEAQLRTIRIGQPVQLSADLYGKKVRYNGRVAGLGVGTGAAFALLPAQNATGNWIKVVQRVPVRIALDAKQLDTYPLRVGLSMEVEVDTHDQNGARLERSARVPDAVPTGIPAAAQQVEAERLIASTIARAIPRGKITP